MRLRGIALRIALAAMARGNDRVDRKRDRFHDRLETIELIKANKLEALERSAERPRGSTRRERGSDSRTRSGIDRGMVGFHDDDARGDIGTTIH